jgi:hypothetical protein
MKRQLFSLGVALALFAPLVLGAESTKQEAAIGEQIKWQVIGGGGTQASSLSYKVNGTVVQTATGIVTSGSYKTNQGYWLGGGCCQALTGNVDCDPGDGCDISDLSALIDNLYISLAPLCCPAEANVDGQPGTDISDLSALIDYLYISFTLPAACQ